MPTPNHFRAYDSNDYHVVAEGKTDANGRAVFDSDSAVSKVAFYDRQGEGDDVAETVLGTGPGGPAGSFDVEIAPDV